VECKECKVEMELSYHEGGLTGNLYEVYFCPKCKETDTNIISALERTKT
jgi:ssDNA-binding Zn-finger/Zn-ribbon topoisomerase 1